MNIIWRRLAVAAMAMVAGTMMSVSMAREAWWMEAEDKASTFTVNDGTIDIIATKGTLIHCWRECKLVQPLWKAVWRFLRKLNIELPFDPAIPLLAIQPEKTTT